MLSGMTQFWIYKKFNTHRPFVEFLVTLKGGGVFGQIRYNQNNFTM